MSRPSVMIVEDEFIISEDLRATVTLLGYSVCGLAETGEEAFRLAVEKEPDLILMDIVLKGEVDGIQAAEQIRSRLPIPIIYITAYGSSEMIARAKRTDPYGYILKPFDSRELRAIMEIALYRAGQESRLHYEKYRFRNLFLQSVDGIVLFDEQGGVIEWNPAQESATGMKREEVIGKPLWEVLHRVLPAGKGPVYLRVKSNILRLIHASRQQRVHRVVDHYLLHPDGTEGFYRTTLFSVVVRDRRFFGLICHDVTGLVRQEKEGKIVPICMECKRVRIESEVWEPVETYVTKSTGVLFSHTLCPECLKRFLTDG